MDYQKARERMLKEQLMARGIMDKDVLAAMGRIPRHQFVDGPMKNEAYRDNPLPIGHNQTISQPYMVALMTEALELTGNEKTLEIGTGSGYQAAILAELSRELYTVEKYPELLDRAKGILESLGYTNIFYKISNGTMGWKEHAPYDAVMVTAGAPEIPQPLVEQLGEGGRLLVPVGDEISQELMKIVRRGGKLFEERLGACRFVKLVGAHGWRA
jgi:protein-L-isoaspartate(D-aspartate) O-methyltransferase